MKALPSYRLRAVHITAAWAFAVSQAVFSLILANPEFLVVRGATRSEVVFFAVTLTLLPPLAFVVADWLLSLASRRAADVLYLVVLALLVVSIGLQVLKKLGLESSAILFIALSAALVVVAVYVRWAPVRQLATFAACLPAIAVLAFVVRAPIITEDAAGADVRVTGKTPVVLLVLDEFPVSSLMTPSGALERARYPNFARLASGATWYRGASTVHESTTRAVPAILTGKLQQHGGLPTLAHHPDNLFTLLGESYRLRVSENVTYLCPKRYCPGRERDSFATRMRGLFADVEVAYLHRVLPAPMARRLPRVDDRWGGFSKERILVAADSRRIIDAESEKPPPAEFATFLHAIRRGEPDRTLHFIHLMLPHTPWRFLPSGRDAGETRGKLVLGDHLHWIQDPWLVRQAYQRHLLQVGYTDSVLGQLLRRLQRLGLYDRALIVVTADHGMSFLPGENARAVTAANLPDVATMPLFVKYPGQQQGRIDDRAARTIDILPTIADVLDVRVPWSVDGRSLLRKWRGPTTVAVAKVNGELVEAPVDVVRRGVAATLRRKAVFGRTWDSLYAAGLPPGLRGRKVASEQVLSTDEARVEFDAADELANVDLSASAIPGWLTGTIEGVHIPQNRVLAVAVNGRIVAPTRSIVTGGGQRFSALVPETAFRNGFNRVELFAVDRRGDSLRLTRIGSNG